MLAGQFRLFAENDVEEDVFANDLVGFFEVFYFLRAIGTFEVGEFFHHFKELVGHEAAHLLYKGREVFVIRSD